LALQYTILQMVFGGKLNLTPLNYPRVVLDCGYGNGEWVKAFAQSYPASQVSLHFVFFAFIQHIVAFFERLLKIKFLPWWPSNFFCSLQLSFLCSQRSYYLYG